jgi:hypothetical protein
MKQTMQGKRARQRGGGREAIVYVKENGWVCRSAGLGGLLMLLPTRQSTSTTAAAGPSGSRGSHAAPTTLTQHNTQHSHSTHTALTSTRQGPGFIILVPRLPTASIILMQSIKPSPIAIVSVRPSQSSWLIASLVEGSRVASSGRLVALHNDGQSNF